MRVGALDSHANHALRGPPCRSIAMSYRSRRRRPASRRSSVIRATPARRGATITSSKCGFPRTTVRASGSTTYVRCASGNLRFNARRSGVVNTTSPISRRRINRILNAGVRGPGSGVRYGIPTVLLWLYRCLVDQHDRDVVFDGVDALAAAAFERGAVLDEVNLRLAVRAGQDFK